MEGKFGALYSISDVDKCSDAELLTLLKMSWGYSNIQVLEVIGRLKVVKTVNTEKGSFFYLVEYLRSANDGGILLYPLKGIDVHHTIFAGSINKQMLGEDSPDGTWVKVRVELSPAKERLKRQNPFALQVVSGSLQLLKEIPGNFSNSSVAINSALYVENWVVDFYRAQSIDKIKEERESLLERLDQDKSRAEQEVRSLSEKEKSLTGLIDESQRELAKNTQDLESIISEKTKQQLAFSRQTTELENKLNKLTEYVKNTASILLDLDLISQAEVDTLLGQNTTKERISGHDFEKVFNRNEQQAVSYIQAFMRKKDILYSRSALEDFFALVRTHDLIILAGDSGSGKTNLVKSFAEAVGGKSVIIPVKPNWTSAEDLLGYYNPLEQKYLTTPFLDALFEAKKNPDVPYFICLDEMNLARVEYYFADFLSLLEERHSSPEISLYSDSESEHLLSEARNFLALIEDSKTKLDKSDLVSFLDLMRDEKVNAKLHELCGFREGDSLLKYHARLRKMLQSYLITPAKLVLPSNVRIIGAINVDETTHYLSPKILDRAHLMRFSSPLLTDWDEIDQEIESFDLDLSLPVSFHADELGQRVPYPEFDRNDALVSKLIYLANEYLDPLGVEFGMRTVRQARHYKNALSPFGVSEEVIFNNIVLHKVLPKLMFDGEKPVDKDLFRKDLLTSLKGYLQSELPNIDSSPVHSCIDELERVIRNAKSNDWVVNYWSR